MSAATFDNHFRRGKSYFELADTFPTKSGTRFETVTLDDEIGPETVVMLTDSTPFAYQLKLEMSDLGFKSGSVHASVGPFFSCSGG